jgi:hypothetical protein
VAAQRGSLKELGVIEDVVNRFSEETLTTRYRVKASVWHSFVRCREE